VDITFGEYLRAMISADVDLVKDDERNYRLAFIDAFRRRGIYPAGIKTLSVESLRYTMEPFVEQKTKDLLDVIGGFLRDYREAISYEDDREKIYTISRDHLGGSNHIKGLHTRILMKFEDSMEFEKLSGLIFSLNKWEQYGVRTSRYYKGPSFRVQNLRLVSRVGPQGNQMNYIIFSLVQRAGVKVNDNIVSSYVPDDKQDPPKNGFELYGGCTMIFDLDTLKLRYSIAKPLLDPDKLKEGIRQVNSERALKQYRYQKEDGVMHLSEQSLNFGAGLRNYFNEPFAFLHSH
jgi:hypothetical protein